MKNLIILFIIPIFCFNSCIRNEKESLSKNAQFPGGIPAMIKYLSEHIQYPEIAIEQNIEGKCMLRFAVEADGSITGVRVSKNVPKCPACDKEAVRVVKSMPKWIPSHLMGIPVKTYFDLPINFHLN